MEGENTVVEQCKYCAERGKTWEGSDPKCAFPYGIFVKDNWNCAAMSILRQACEVTYGPDDINLGTIVLDGNYVNDDLLTRARIESGFITLSWYKSRGTTGQALFVSDDLNTPVTIEHVEAIKNQYDKK